MDGDGQIGTGQERCDLPSLLERVRARQTASRTAVIQTMLTRDPEAVRNPRVVLFAGQFVLPLASASFAVTGAPKVNVRQPS